MCGAGDGSHRADKGGAIADGAGMFFDAPPLLPDDDMGDILGEIDGGE